MDYLKAIDYRVSRRSYLGSPIDLENRQALEHSISLLNEESGLSIRLIEDGSQAFGIMKDYGMFSGVKSLFLMAGNIDDPHLREKIGRCGEMLVLEATSLGLGTCWVGGTFDRNSEALSLPEGKMAVAVIPVGNVSSNGGFKEKLIRKLVHRKTKSVEDMYSSDVETPPDWFIRGVEAAQKAPSAINRQPVVFEYKDGSATASVPGDSNFEFIDLGIAKLHFELAAGGRFELGNRGLFKPI